MNDFPNLINFANILMYTDDIKDFLCGLNNLFLWCDYNMMEVDIKICKCMRFSLNNFIAVNYVLGGHQLERVDSFIDLRILLDTK